MTMEWPRDIVGQEIAPDALITYAVRKGSDAHMALATCHPDRPHHAKGLCMTCYNKSLRRREEHPRASCHPDRPHRAKGLCYSCYETERRRTSLRRADCHPDRPHWAKGLCATCYYAQPDKVTKSKWQRRKSRYGLSPEEYERVWSEQNGLCAICGAVATDIDHDHATGAFRGLLCGKCNTALGLLGDSIENIDRAACYMRSSQTRSLAGEQNRG